MEIIYIIILIIILILIIVNIRCRRNIDIYETMSNKKIPYVLYKTGPFEKIPDKIKKVINICCNKLDTIYKYFDDNMCREFIKDNFNKKILQAYDLLIPTAFKADLFRYCILYLNGGIYGDLTQEVLYNYDINSKNVDMILVKDGYVCNNNNNIQVSFIATIPRNNLLKYIINNICNNILKKDIGKCPLDITGPTSFGRYFCKYFNIDNIELGLKTYNGLDKTKYIIDINFKQKNNGYLIDLNNKNFIKTKIKNHKSLLYSKNHNNYNYAYQYKNKNIFI